MMRRVLLLLVCLCAMALMFSCDAKKIDSTSVAGQSKLVTGKKKTKRTQHKAALKMKKKTKKSSLIGLEQDGIHKKKKKKSSLIGLEQDGIHKKKTGK